MHYHDMHCCRLHMYIAPYRDDGLLIFMPCTGWALPVHDGYCCTATAITCFHATYCVDGTLPVYRVRTSSVLTPCTTAVDSTGTPYHTISYHTIPSISILHHIIPYHTIPYHTIPYHTIPYHTIPYYTDDLYDLFPLQFMISIFRVR